MITRRLARPSGALSPSNWVCPSCVRLHLIPPTTQPPLTLSLHHQRTTTSPLLHRARQSRQPAQTRALVTVPQLSAENTFSEHGVPGLFSKLGFKIAWTDYQAQLVQKLNDLLADDPAANKLPKDLAIETARDPMNASVFNHASMAHNNHFFFSGLSPSPQQLDSCPALKDSLEATFGSIDTLRTTMLDTASAMFGPGFVWLVWTRKPGDGSSAYDSSGGSFRVLSTYIAGTPYSEAGYRQQGLDMATNNAGTFATYQQEQRQGSVTNTVGSFGPMSAGAKQDAKYPPGGTQVVPVLCVNTWEHVYIYDFGLGGKRRYLSEWWDAIDWHKVQQNKP